MSKHSIRVQILPATVLAVLLVSSAAAAQTFRGRVTEIVKDESMAVVAGATVTLTNVGFACPATLGLPHEEEL